MNDTSVDPLSIKTGDGVSQPALFAVFVLLSILIAAVGWHAYTIRKHAITKNVQAELSAIADLKAQQIIHWREERYTDAAVLQADPLLAPMIGRHSRFPQDREAPQHLAEMLSKLTSLKSYRSAALLDVHGKQLLITPGGLGICGLPDLRALFDSAIASGEVAMSDLHMTKDSAVIHLSLFVPIVSDADSTAAGAIVLDLDPERFLYPLIQSWPMPSRSAEIYLIRKESDEILFLNELRHRKTTALRFRLPLAQSDLPAARALSGFTGVMEGMDYRAVPVLAATRPIPGTSWYMVAKMDTMEAFAAARLFFLIIITFIILSIILSGVLLALFQRHRASSFFRRLYAFEREKHELYASLSESEKLLRTQFVNSPDIILMIDTDFRIITINRIVAGNFTVEDIRGMDAVAVLPPEYRATAKEHIERCVETRTIQEFEHGIGDGKWVKARVVPILQDDKVHRVLILSTDITERKKAMEELIWARHRSQRYLDTVEAIIVVLDAQGQITLINRKGCRLLGYEEAELIGELWFETCLPAPLGMETVYPVFQKLISGEMASLEYFENPVITRQGTIRHIAWHNSLLRDDAGNITGVLSAGEDITERRKAEADLVDEKERLLVTIRSIGDAVIATDTRGMIVLMNKVAESLTGWEFTAAKGRPLADVFVIINERTRRPCENPVDKVLKTGSIVNLANDTLLVNRDGVEIVIADSGAPIHDRENVIIGVVLVFRDTTEKRRAEKAIQKAEHLDSLGVLAGGIAHDFNNLLGGLFGYLDLARCTLAANDAAAEFIDKALSVFGRAKNLTGQLLTFAKGGAPARTTRALSPLIRDTVQFALSGSAIKPVFEIAADLFTCDIDENQMGQVIDNVVINARDAMPRGGVISVTAVNTAPDAVLPVTLAPGRYVRISIRDQGTGIPPDILHHIFDPFFTTKQKGSGLGLAVSYSIIKRHDGLIEAESRLGKGTVIHIYLPASANNAVTGEHTAAVEHRGHGRILIMDDEKYIREVASLILTRMGYEVDKVACGEEAIEMFAKAKNEGRPYLLAILDLTIPGGMGGKETNKKLRKCSPGVKIIASSGYSNDPVMAHPREHGFDSSIRKPYHKAEMEEAVTKVMSEPLDPSPHMKRGG
ncbi:MAG: PAS domain S-box protein [Chitinispirillaceae bacterium]|nr:PAS domain S-box protein [Chitinispirillaceae bacterium]